MAARLTAYAVAFIVGVTFIAGLIVGAQREDDGAVDVIVINGKVYAADGGADLAEAVAIRGNKVIRVGSNREIQRLKRAQTVVVDARGGAVMPGFIDAHAHLISGGLSLDQISLGDAATVDEIKDTIRVWSEAHPERAWITGRGWYYQPFNGAMPTRQMLDALVPDRPAYLIAYDGHTGWANTKALKAAGITRRTKSPANGAIVKDSRGEPTGALKEAAMALMAAAAPKPTEEDRLAAARAAIDEAHRFGITSVQDAGGAAADLDLFDRLRKRKELTLRVYQALRADATLTEANLDELEQVRTRFADDPVLKTGAIKLIADGVIESHTAAMLEPYANRPAITGDARFTPEQLNKVVAMLDKRGWQVMTHAIGDAAVRMTLDAYQSAAKANPAPERGRRHRIEHIETIDPDDVPRFAQARRHRLVPTRSRHAEPDAGRCVERQPRRGARLTRLDVEQHRQERRPPRVRQRLAGDDPRSAQRFARRGHAHDAGRIARRRMDPERAPAAAPGDRRLHARRRLGVFRRAAQGCPRPRHARRHRRPHRRHLFRASQPPDDHGSGRYDRRREGRIPPRSA